MMEQNDWQGAAGTFTLGSNEFSELLLIINFGRAS